MKLMTAVNLQLVRKDAKGKSMLKATSFMMTRQTKEEKI